MDRAPKSPGWVGWVSAAKLQIEKDGKSRPWCRANAGGGGVPWIPRTSQQPVRDRAWALHSPAQHAGLDAEGWFLVSRYLSRPTFFDPGGREAGRVEGAYLQQLQSMLGRFFLEQLPP